MHQPIVVAAVEMANPVHLAQNFATHEAIVELIDYVPKLLEVLQRLRTIIRKHPHQPLRRRGVFICIRALRIIPQQGIFGQNSACVEAKAIYAASHPEPQHVRSAMADVLRFWMRRGVNGFRFDASAVLAEDALLRDDPESPDADENTPPPQRLMRVFSDDRPESLQYLKELRHVIDEFDDRLLCGEVQGKMDRIGHFYGSDNNRLMHLPLNFALLDSPWKAHSLQATIDAYYNAIPDHAFPDWVIGGHDKHRAASKVGQEQARCLAMLLLTLKGTAFFFAGDELATEQARIPEGAVQDPFENLVPGYDLNRDPER